MNAAANIGLLIVRVPRALLSDPFEAELGRWIATCIMGGKDAHQVWFRCLDHPWWIERFRGRAASRLRLHGASRDAVPLPNADPPQLGVQLQRRRAPDSDRVDHATTSNRFDAASRPRVSDARFAGGFGPAGAHASHETTFPRARLDASAP